MAVGGVVVVGVVLNFVGVVVVVVCMHGVRSLPLLVYVDMASGPAWEAKAERLVRQKSSVRLTQHTYLFSPYSTM